MSAAKGVFIGLEGSDGSGKATQVQLLKKRLETDGYDVALFAFPRYDQPSSHFIRQYLKGAYGLASSVNPYTASLFYALDRYEAAPQIQLALSEGKIVLADRYTGSNMAHQGAKFANPAERRGFFVWAESTEYQLLGIPRPNINLFLRVPAEISFKLLTGRPAKDAASQLKDQHEANFEHLEKAVETYDMLCQLFAADYKAIDCVKDGNLMDRQAIHTVIYQAIKPLLPPSKSLRQAVRAPEPVKKIASRQAKDSKRRLTGDQDKIKWEVDGISLIAAYGLQQAGLGVDIDYATSWSGPGTAYKYQVPEALNEADRQTYKKAYDRVAELHKNLASKLYAAVKSKKLAGDLIKTFVPMGAVFSARVELAQEQTASTLEKLRVHPNQEITALLGSLNFALDQKNSADNDEPPAKTDGPQSVNDILDKLAVARPDYGADLEPLKIIEFNPRNEFELIADRIYPSSSLTRDEILLALDQLTYDQKAGELKKALRSEAVLRLPAYRFDALSDWLTLSTLMSDQKVEVIHAQQLTTRYGYDVPAKIESLDLEDPYMEMFDGFLDLYSQLQREYDEDITQYATLIFNKVRWQGRVTAAGLKTALNQEKNNSGSFIEQLVNKVREIHPLTAAELLAPASRNYALAAKPPAKKK
jgi:dTMP kinase